MHIKNRKCFLRTTKIVDKIKQKIRENKMYHQFITGSYKKHVCSCQSLAEQKSYTNIVELILSGIEEWLEYPTKTRETRV